MGGTSTDVALLREGRPVITNESKIDRLPLRVPMIDITTVGAGGGSIAWIDSGGLLDVGPASAGAEPGPACYGRGGSAPTVTDANVCILSPSPLLDGPESRAAAISSPAPPRAESPGRCRSGHPGHRHGQYARTSGSSPSAATTHAITRWRLGGAAARGTTGREPTSGDPAR
jgi:hypothetical protein